MRRQRVKRSTGPALSAPDTEIGTCDGSCGCTILRRDNFVITLSKQLYCLPCWEKQPGISYPLTRGEIEAALPKRPAPPAAPAPTVETWDGATPYF